MKVKYLGNQLAQFHNLYSKKKNSVVNTLNKLPYVTDLKQS